ncbi:hypothetical protein PF005_g25272 [Phytophthora fragariae]|uniref:Uncharacterized protein n=1 Tax=Phytophthora fragariae TaxID=53985 RepID=A0A6A3VYM9_9STRA|nr:hypothetical protein PF009_g25999 [Phytophthora fragariae]KAE9062259.1 hypothetical protein PF010_g29477 [Phytophthora fragariae]KAE9175725.1 hypothetical protein PF005_g25272 [Phytophthora fragariae]KAE9180588.1 hypothetical protein PF004_g24794 [Phytophthora fragariae]KAE9188139.1 hypothetical protein PF002_g25391 [Phytophthora fragariae]
MRTRWSGVPPVPVVSVIASSASVIEATVGARSASSSRKRDSCFMRRRRRCL